MNDRQKKGPRKNKEKHIHAKHLIRNTRNDNTAINPIGQSHGSYQKEMQDTKSEITEPVFFFFHF